jgi:hypothetical protein
VARAWDTCVDRMVKVVGGHGNGGCDIMMSVAWGGHGRDAVERSIEWQGGRQGG